MKLFYYYSYVIPFLLTITERLILSKIAYILNAFLCLFFFCLIIKIVICITHVHSLPRLNTRSPSIIGYIYFRHLNGGVSTV